MKCRMCKNGNTATGTHTVTLEKNDTVLVVRQVPADICENCGEYYLDADVSTTLWEMVNRAVKHHAELEILNYATHGELIEG